MSIDLDWSKLDASYASSLIDVLNRQLQSTPRPSFIGPIEITSFEFGSQPPVVELVDLRDIYRDFLEDDDDDDVEGANNIDAAEGGSRFSAAGNGQDRDDHDHEDDDEFEWVSRRSARRGTAMDEAAAPMYYHHLPPHVRYARGPASDVHATDVFALDTPPYYGRRCTILLFLPLPFTSTPRSRGCRYAPTPEAAAADEHPNLQLHLLVSWHSDLRLTLTTSLRINYPSPLFMSLPIKLSVTGLVFEGELAVAYEGGRRRGLAGQHAERPRGGRCARGEPLPVGQRLLPEIFIESELGQADKHKFIQDVIRKTVEEELVFPNFHTLVLK
ncbi:hypothetical protein BJV77DRAFT_1059023 [Russula vinacea]|nr:hypothetical protein BJV77DRAFT_1059023 [Russula vinacea]